MKSKEDTIEELGSAPNDKYKKFFAQFSEITALPSSQWKTVHVLGYFCKKYEEAYQTPYKFKFNSPAPSKCFEVFQIKKLALQLTAKPDLLKEYIDWAFQTKVVQAKRKLTSISFLTQEDTLTEYKKNVLWAPKIERTTSLPEHLKNIFKEHGINISTYGELSFIHQMTNKPEHIERAMSNIEQTGFDISILNKIV